MLILCLMLKFVLISCLNIEKYLIGIDIDGGILNKNS